MLQAHPSSCSQQGPTWPSLLSSPTATATQQHQATASRHSPASVTACERPRRPPTPHTHPPQLDPTPSLHLSFSLCSSPASYGLLLTTGATSKRQPTLVSSTIFYSVVLSQDKTFNCIQRTSYYLYCLKRNWTTCLFVFHIPYL